MSALRLSIALVICTAATAALAKSADECRDENASVPEEKRQQAVIDCLVESASPSAPPAPAPKRVKPTIGTPSPAQVTKVRAALADKLRDPYSAVLTDLRTLRFGRADKELTICGTVNAKNAFGAYVGKRPFYFSDDGRDRFVWIHGSDDFETNIVETLCLGK